MFNIAKKRGFFKKLKNATALPEPLRSYEDFLQLQNLDLDSMDRMELRAAFNAAEISLMLLGKDDKLLYMDSQGNFITARTYLLRRIAKIKRLWRGGGGIERRNVG